jgi:hypothetical protein
VDNADGTYTIDYLVAEGDSDVLTGALTCSLTLTDAAGNISSLIDAIPVNSLSIDANSPVITGLRVVPDLGVEGIDSLIVLNITADGNDYTASQIILNTIDITGSNFINNGDNSYSADYIVSLGDPNVAPGAISASVALTDPAGNTSSAFTTVDLNSLQIITQPPDVLSLSVSPDSGLAKIGDTITLNITADVAGYSAFEILLNNVNITGSNFQDLGGGSYSADYIIAEGDSDVAPGAITASVVLEDVAENRNIAFTTVDANTLSIDANTPVVTGLSVSPSSGWAKIGDTVTLNITADGNDYTASELILNTVTITGSNFQNLGGGSYSADYTIAEGDSDVASGAITASVILTDPAGNSSLAFTTVDAKPTH